MAKFHSIPTKRLAESITASDTSFSIRTNTDWNGVALNPADFDAEEYGVFRNETNTKLEFFCYDATDIGNGNLTIVRRGLDYNGDLTTEITDNKKNWIKGETLVELGSDPAQLFQWLKEYVNDQDNIIKQAYGELAGDDTITGQWTFNTLPESASDPTGDKDLSRKKYVNDQDNIIKQAYGELAGDDTITGQWTFNTLPKSALAPTGAGDLANKAYVDNTVTGVAASNTRVVITGNAGETVAVGDLISLNESDNEWYKVDIDTASTYEDRKIGIAQGAGTDGNGITDGVLIYGLDLNQSGLTPGTRYYASSTAGDIGTTKTSLDVGTAKSATNLFFDPQTWILGEDIIDEASASATASENAGKAVKLESDGKFSADFLRNVSTNVETFTADGTWTKPAGLLYAVVEIVGGGGGGGDGDIGSSRTGGGGGGAGYAKKTFNAADLGATETVIIGSGGSGQNVGAATAGGDTTFGTHMTANGGSPGSSSTPGSGGSATGGDVNSVGFYGAQGNDSGSNTNILGPIRIGGRSALRNSYGQGGLGGDSESGTNSEPGNAGANGVVIVTEYSI